MNAGRVQEPALDVGLRELRACFAGSAAALEVLHGDEGAREGASSLTPASVLVPIVARAGGLTVLLTRRTPHLRAHSGQVSFPGGKAEPHDPSPEHTALREAREEIGLEPAQVELLGRLSLYHTRTGFRITPVVGIVALPLVLQPDAHEVAEVFEVPLAFLLDPANHQHHAREIDGRPAPYWAIPYRQHHIWGATAAMLVNLYRHLSAAPARQ